MNLLVIVMAVSLSMDAFSLALAYGLAGVSSKQKIIVPITVGIFHFFMPLFGMLLGNFILSKFMINYDLLVFVILIFIGIQMILDSFKEKKAKKFSFLEIILFALAVSIDSFSVGITLTDINDNYLISAFIFALTSAFFTFVGLFFGDKIANLVGKVSTVIGGILLIIIGILYLL